MSTQLKEKGIVSGEGNNCDAVNKFGGDPDRI